MRQLWRFDRNKKRRTKQIKAVKTKGLAGKRKQYAALKKQVRKALVAEKKTRYTRENERIKKLPVKQRATARKKVKTDLKRKFDALVKQMPAVGKKGHEELASLISKVGKIKWT